MFNLKYAWRYLVNRPESQWDDTYTAIRLVFLVACILIPFGTLVVLGVFHAN
jgi:hypothetical protein